MMSQSYFSNETVFLFVLSYDKKKMEKRERTTYDPQ